MTLLSQTTEYALRAMVHLATADRRRSVKAISEAVGVPEAYLGKVLQHLLRARLVTARRGPGGGIALVAPAESVTVLDIVNAVDPIEHVQRCPLGRSVGDGQLCPLHAHVQAATEHIEQAFASTTLADLTHSDHAPLCAIEGTGNGA
ncbi:MAG: Rrf2 family transcriptional regulator [Armatimonadetes bacterium]|nr:Rrf2 family transcriptional regulator [Armatimonadota bacterium]